MFAETCTPDLRLENTSTAVTDKTYVGAEGVREWINDFVVAFAPGARHEIEEILAVGEDYVVAAVRWSGHGSRSGAPLVLRWVTVMWFEGRKMSRGVGYPNRHAALKAVGLEE